MGLIPRWSRLGGAAPGLANFLASTPGFSDIAKALGGISSKRKIPAQHLADAGIYLRDEERNRAPVLVLPVAERHVVEPD